MIIWRGWGLLIFFVPIFVFIICAVLAPGARGHESNIILGRAGAISLVISAGLMWLMWNYRQRRAPDIDHFYYVPTKIWVYIFLVGAVAALIAPYIVG